MRNCTHYKYIIYTRQMDFKLNTGSCCMGKKGCSKIQNNKLNTYDWLCDVPDAANATDYVEVQFKNTRKGYYLNSSKIPLEKGDLVAVEASPGHDIGTVTLTGKLVLLQMKKNNVRTGEGNEPKKVYRKAKPTDIEKYEEAKAKEHATMIRSRQIAADLGLNMKIGDVEYQGDGNKAIFYYIADERVDFRQLIKVLAEAFRVRIEMKQIGARQEAGRIGGIGPCGRELCCSSWMTSFVSVATGAARYQDISMNPQKLAGQCAKLKCCINYEVDAYVEAQKRLPSREVVLETKDNTYYHFKTDIFKREITYSTDKSFAANLITISANRAFDVINMNKKGMKPVTLEADTKPQPPKRDAQDILGQDSVTRFDASLKKKKKKEGEEDEPIPTKFLPVNVNAPSSMDVYGYVSLNFEEPIASFDTAAIHLRQKVDTIWKDIPFEFEQDSLNLRRFNLYPANDWDATMEYEFSVDSTAFHGIYGLFTDKIKQSFKVRSEDEYFTLHFIVTGADPQAFIELLDTQDKVVRRRLVDDGRADFYYLNPGKYAARLINDRNGNGEWDTGDYAKGIQPEEVYYFPKVVEYKALWDVDQNWDIHATPVDTLKLDELKKQKPDEDKKKKERERDRNNQNRNRR